MKHFIYGLLFSFGLAVILNFIDINICFGIISIFIVVWGFIIDILSIDK